MAVRCTRIDEETAEKAITRIIQKLGYSQLKPEQLKVIMEFLCGKDVFAILPTGFGKTLCYACLPLVFDELTHRRTPSIILVVCHATTGPPKIGPPGPPLAAAAGPPGPFTALQMVPSDQRWRHGWSPFAIVGPP